MEMSELRELREKVREYEERMAEGDEFKEGDIVDLVNELKESVIEATWMKQKGEDLYQLATRAEFYPTDWEDFERIHNEFK